MFDFKGKLTNEQIINIARTDSYRCGYKMVEIVTEVKF